MKTDSLQRLDFSVYTSELHGHRFVIVPPRMGTQVWDADKMICAYMQYQLAIKPVVPVVIFRVSSLVDVGSMVFAGDPVIYHLPPRVYPKLQEIVLDDVFCVSDSYLVHVLEASRLNSSIFSIIPETHKEIGLNVLGVCEDDVT